MPRRIRALAMLRPIARRLHCRLRLADGVQVLFLMPD